MINASHHPWRNNLSVCLVVVIRRRRLCQSIFFGKFGGKFREKSQLKQNVREKNEILGK